MAVNVAQAFVQVVPTTENFLQELRNELGAPIEAEGEKTGGSFMGKFGKAAIAAAGAVGAAIGAAAGVIIKNSIGEGMELEQNLGGTEAVFGVFADNIQSKAADAYKTMGLSASEYMQAANKIGALFQGSGESTVKSLTLTQVAMQRAADVASVMGIETTSALDAITNAAKGNFSMMDNLGVAMNATTLEAYAAEKGMESFTWKTASNLEKTELAMQMFLERTQQYEGNFAREAAETLSGSLGAMQSAFKNVLGNLALGRDIGPSLESLAATVKDFLINNLIPAVKNIVSALPGAFITILQEFAPLLITEGANLIRELVTIIATVAPDIMAAAWALINELAAGLIEAIPQLAEAVPQIITGIVNFLLDGTEQIIAVGVELLTALVGALPQVVAGITEALPTIIKALISFFANNEGMIIRAGLDLFTALIGALPDIITNIINAIPEIIVAIIEALVQEGPQLVLAGFELLAGLFTQLPAVLALAAEAVAQLVAKLLFGFNDKVGEIKDAGRNFLLGFADGIGQSVAAVVERARQAAAAVLGAVKNFFDIHSPSRVMNKEVGLQIMAGEAQGIAENSDLVTNAIRTASDEAYKTFDADIAYNAAVNAEQAQNGAVGQSATARAVAEMVQAIRDMKIYLDTGELVGGTSTAMDNALGAVGMLESRGIA